MELLNHWFNALEHWLDLIVSGIGSFIAALVGVAMRHAHKVQRGDPLVWSRIVLDTPTIFVMGLIGYVAGEYLHSSYSAPELLGSVLSSCLGYLGPTVVDRFLEYLERRAKND